VYLGFFETFEIQCHSGLPTISGLAR
jgi:hypothetical protein